MTYKRKGRQERGSTREVKTRISVSEYEEWKHRADLAGITVAEYIRSCVRNGRINIIIKNEIEIKPLADIAQQYGKIGSNLNQIARYLNEGGTLSDQLKLEIRSMISDLYSINTELTRLYEVHYGNSKTHFE